MKVKFAPASGMENTLFVELIEVPVSQRGHGLGRRVLDILCQTADAREWVLRGAPSGDLGSDFSRLLAWYRSAGFEVDSGIPDVTMTMARYPRAVTFA